MHLQRPTVEWEDRLGLAIAEYLEAIESGTALPRDELLSRFPDVADDLREFFTNYDDIGELAEPLRPSAAARDTSVAGKASTAAPRPSKHAPAPLGAFGDYELLEEIARGGMGVVYKARHRSLNRIVALKMIAAGRFATPQELQRFRFEAEAAARLDHPHLVPIYEAGDVDGQRFFSMKYVEGGSLAARRRAAAPTPQQAARLVAIVARAVHYAHQRGILHRDLKPANVLLDSAGEPHVTDFGLARPIPTLHSQPGAPLTQSGMAVGTPSYMAPEQATGPNDAISTSADVYSLGAILYELLTGEPPFSGQNPYETIRQLMELEPRRPRALSPHIPIDLEVICLRCLEKRPEARYPSAQALAEDLERWLEGRPILARPSSLWERAAKWVRRRPAVAGLLAGLAVVGLASVIGLTALWLRAKENADNHEREWRRAENHASHAEKEWGRAEGNAENAERERRRAEANLQTAQRAVRDFVRLSENRFDEYSDSREIRRRQLEAAQRYFSELLEQKKDDVRARADVADACLHLADIELYIGSRSMALQHAEDAVRRYAALATEDPDSARFARYLASARRTCGFLLGVLGRPEALDALQRAKALQEELVKRFPGQSDYCHDLELTCRMTGDWQRGRFQFDDALKAYNRGREVLEPHVSGESNKFEFLVSLAVLEHNRALLLRDMSRREEAIQAGEGARKLRMELANENRKGPETPYQLAMSLNLLATLQMDIGKSRQASMYSREALGLLEPIVRDYPLVHRFQFALAATCCDLAIQEYFANSSPEAHKVAERAWAICERMAREHPDSLEYADKLVEVCTNLSVFYRRLNRLAESQRACELGRTILGKLLTMEPASLRHRLSLATITGNLGRLQDEQGQRDAALASLTEGIGRGEEIVAQAPSYITAVRLLRNDLAWRAEVFTRAGRHPEANADWQRALQLTPERDITLLRGRRALTRARAGLLPAALGEAEELATAPRLNRATGYDLAAVYALASAAARRDESLDAEERTRRGEQHATTSIDLLKRLVSSGAFREPVQVERIKKDKDFDSLRERPEFAEFLKEISAKPPAAGQS